MARRGERERLMCIYAHCTLYYFEFYVFTYGDFTEIRDEPLIDRYVEYVELFIHAFKNPCDIIDEYLVTNFHAL